MTHYGKKAVLLGRQSLSPPFYPKKTFGIHLGTCGTGEQTLSERFLLFPVFCCVFPWKTLAVKVNFLYLKLSEPTPTPNFTSEPVFFSFETTYLLPTVALFRGSHSMSFPKEPETTHSEVCNKIQPAAPNNMENAFVFQVAGVAFSGVLRGRLPYGEHPFYSAPDRRKSGDPGITPGSSPFRSQIKSFEGKNKKAGRHQVPCLFMLSLLVPSRIPSLLSAIRFVLCMNMNYRRGKSAFYFPFLKHLFKGGFLLCKN